MVKELGAAINRAVEKSNEVTDAIQTLRSAGYQLELTLRLEIGLRAPTDQVEEIQQMAHVAPRDVALDFTAEDIATLRRMKIRMD